MNQRRKRSGAAPRREDKPIQEVHYTPPAPISRKKLILEIVSVLAVAVAVFLGLAVFFRVEYVNVSGNVKYDAWTIREASGIQQGESLLSFGKARAAGRITHALPYVSKVRVGITLPSTVNIYIEELEVVYAAQDDNNGWWLLTSNGRIVERTEQSKAQTNTVLSGFLLRDPKVGQQASAVEVEPGAVDENGNPIVVTVTNTERLNMALQILQLLERNGIIGNASSVNVEKMGAIELWYGRQYQVKLGNKDRMEEKIASMKQAITQMGDHQSGVLDITFTKEPNKVIYNPSRFE